MPKLTPAANNQPPEAERRGSYFLQPESDDDDLYFSSGCAVVDCILSTGGRGWRLGRMANVVGDSSTSKTGIAAIEAFANFSRKFPKGKMWYREAEGAFDRPYGRKMGMPEGVSFWEDDYEQPLDTVEDVFEDLERILSRTRTQPGLYVLDSLDSLTDRAEKKRKVDQASYGQDKAKQVGKLFRVLVRELEKASIAVVVVSQLRENIGVMFGEKKRRSGGKAMDFYASHCLWLRRKEVVAAKTGKVERPTGIIVEAFLKKNKLGLPLRKADYLYRFGWGVDDVLTSLRWLESASLLKETLGVADTAVFLKTYQKLDRDSQRQARDDLSSVVKESWARIDEALLPAEGKYSEAG